MTDSETHALARVVAGRYRLARELGRGGMGVVWLAEDQLVGRQVAVKELRAPAGLAEEERETFSRRALSEARSAARIRHQGAVTLFDVLPASAADDAVYLIMELVTGPTLAQLIERSGPLPAPAVAAYGLQLLSVLEAAHGLGIVHRDIKPANIIVTAAGLAKLTDFGIAHTVGDARLTRSGIMGTQAYMAPELFESAAITPAADVWSLGATLYCAAEGRGPFDRDTTGATLRAILLDDLPPLRCPPPLAAAITGMLQRDPARRASIGQARGQLLQAAQTPAPAQPSGDPATASLAPQPDGSVGTAVLRPSSGQETNIVALAPQAGPLVSPPASWEQSATTRSPSGPPVPPPQPWLQAPPPAQPQPGRRRQLIIGAVAAAVLVAAAAVTVPLVVLHSNDSAQNNNPGPSPNTSYSTPPGTVSPVTGTAPTTTLAGPGDDTNTGNGQYSETGVTSVAYSPDSTTLATGDENGDVYLWSTATSKVTATLTGNSSSNSTVEAVAFSPNGQLLAAGLNDDYTYVWNVATQHLVASLNDGGSGSNVVTAIAFSPNSQLLAAGDADDRTYVFNLGTGHLVNTLIDLGFGGIASVAFSPDGTMLATLDQDDQVYMWSVATGKELFTLTPGSTSSGNTGDSVAFSPDGKMLAVGDSGDNVYLFNVATQQVASTLTQPNNGTGGVQYGVDSIAFSPDGQTLAAGDDDGNVYLWNVTSGKQGATLSDAAASSADSSGQGGQGSPAQVNSVAFSPDGKMVAAGVNNDDAYVWPAG